MDSACSASVMAEEQLERLRRFVDEWRTTASDKAREIHVDVLEAVCGDAGSMTSDPLRIAMELKDPSSVLALVDTNNILFNKLITVLSYDCIEIERLRRQAQRRFYPQLLAFGLPTGPEELVVEGEPQKAFGRSLLFFNNLAEFLGRLKAVLGNLVHQLEAISPGESKRSVYPSFVHVQLQTAVLSLANGFSILVTLDGIISKNPAIGQAVSLFIRMLHTVKTNPLQFAVEMVQVESLDGIMTHIKELLQCGLFQRFLKHEGSGNSRLERMRPNCHFLDEILQSSREGFTLLLSRLDTLKERPNDRVQLVGLLAVFIFHAWICGDSPERKSGKIISECIRRAPVLHVYCGIKVQPLEFLTFLSPAWVLSWSVLKELQKEASTLQTSYLTVLDDTLSRDIHALQRNVANWVTTFDSTTSSKKMSIQALSLSRSRQLLDGINLAWRLHHLLRATLEMHVALEVPVKKEKMVCLFQAVTLLKAIEEVYYRRCSETAQFVPHILQNLQSLICKQLHPWKVQLEAELAGKSRTSNLGFLGLTRSGKDMDFKLLDSLASVDLALKMLGGVASEKRHMILTLCLDVFFSLQPAIQESARSKIVDLLSELDIIINLNNLLEASTDCSFLHSRRELMSTWFSMLYNEPQGALQIQFVLNAFLDGFKLLKRGNADGATLSRFEDDLQTAITKDLIDPLCQDMETDLRLHVHSAHMTGSVTVNPTKTGVRDLSWFLLVKPLRLVSKYIHIKARAEMYLNTAFYNHTAMALHNWKTYTEMRHLAEQKYGLCLEDIHLPGKTLEQGVDILEIVHNIHAFAASYTYDLNTQVFIERITNAKERKYLHSISVKHVTTSIRTYGIGIMSTTVNLAYQYLAQKFLIFSQFLYGDHIKSLLLKELRFWKECQGKEEYSFARAEKLTRDIKKLGVENGCISFLDQFRQLVAEMGNVLGFVRMVRMGGLHYYSAASGLVQDVTAKDSFKEAAIMLNMNGACVNAGAVLDKSLKLQGMPVEQTNYFRILIGVFAEELRSSDYPHLEKFYLVLPVLTINAVAGMLQAKERLFKRGRDSLNGLVVDDGLVLGIAYILRVLDQNKQFNALHWFESPKKHFIRERDRVQDGLNMDNIESGMKGLQVWSQKFASLSEEEVQNMQLVIKQLNSYLIEFELLEYNFTSARMFFQ